MDHLIECVDLCEDVYKENSKGETITDGRFDSKVSVINNQNNIIITFRGTHSLNNWVNNLYLGIFPERLSHYFDIKFKDYHDLEGHHGFFTIVQRLYLQIKDKIESKSIPIRIYGHSLGGALACICAYCLAYEDYNIEAVVSIGSPRVFKKGQIKTPEASYKEIVPNYIRLANRNDIVTFVPLHKAEKQFDDYQFEDVSQSFLNNSVKELYRLYAVVGLIERGNWLTNLNEAKNVLMRNVVLDFVHVGKFYILDEIQIKEIGYRDVGRQIKDIPLTAYIQYAKYLKPVYVGLAGLLGVAIASRNLATVAEEITSNQFLLDLLREFKFDWKKISYSTTNIVFTEDPFYQKLLRLYGNDMEVRTYLPLLDFARGRRHFFAVDLPNLMENVVKWTETKLKDYPEFNESTEEQKIDILETVINEWIDNDNIVIGNTKSQAKTFFVQVRNGLLRKFRGFETKNKIVKRFAERTGGLMKTLGFDPPTKGTFLQQQRKTIIFLSVVSLVQWFVVCLLIYKITYQGSYEHQISVYRHNILRHIEKDEEGLSIEEIKNRDIRNIPSRRLQPLAFTYVNERDMGKVILL